MTMTSAIAAGIAAAYLVLIAEGIAAWIAFKICKVRERERGMKPCMNMTDDEYREFKREYCAKCGKKGTAICKERKRRLVDGKICCTGYICDVLYGEAMFERW